MPAALDLPRRPDWDHEPRRASTSGRGFFMGCRGWVGRHFRLYPLSIPYIRQMTLLKLEKKGVQKYYGSRGFKPKVSFTLYKDSNRGIVGFATLTLLPKTIYPWLVPTTECFLSGTQKKN